MHQNSEQSESATSKTKIQRLKPSIQASKKPSKVVGLNLTREEFFLQEPLLQQNLAQKSRCTVKETFNTTQSKPTAKVAPGLSSKEHMHQFKLKKDLLFNKMHMPAQENQKRSRHKTDFVNFEMGKQLTGNPLKDISNNYQNRNQKTKQNESLQQTSRHSVPGTMHSQYSAAAKSPVSTKYNNFFDISISGKAKPSQTPQQLRPTKVRTANGQKTSATPVSTTSSHKASKLVAQCPTSRTQKTHL